MNYYNGWKIYLQLKDLSNEDILKWYKSFGQARKMHMLLWSIRTFEMICNGKFVSQKDIASLKYLQDLYEIEKTKPTKN